MTREGIFLETIRLYDWLIIALSHVYVEIFKTTGGRRLGKITTIRPAHTIHGQKLTRTINADKVFCQC